MAPGDSRPRGSASIPPAKRARTDAATSPVDQSEVEASATEKSTDLNSSYMATFETMFRVVINFFDSIQDSLPLTVAEGSPMEPFNPDRFKEAMAGTAGIYSASVLFFWHDMRWSPQKGAQASARIIKHISLRLSVDPLHRPKGLWFRVRGSASQHGSRPLA